MRPARNVFTIFFRTTVHQTLCSWALLLLVVFNGCSIPSRILFIILAMALGCKEIVVSAEFDIWHSELQHGVAHVNLCVAYNFLR